MDVRLIFIFLLASSSQAIISPSTIDADAAEITNLNEILKSVSPPVFHRSQSLVCEMIEKCCSFIKPRLSKYIGDPITGSTKLMDTCIGHHSYQTVLAKCPVLAKSIEIYRDKNFARFVAAIRSALTEVQSVDVNVPLMCSSEEAHAVLCNGNNRKMVESCERKRLIHVAEHRSEKDYRAFVSEMKKNLLLFISSVEDAFPTTDITETIISSIDVDVEESSLVPLSSTDVDVEESSFVPPPSAEKITSVPLNSAHRSMWTFFPLFTLLLLICFYPI